VILSVLFYNYLSLIFACPFYIVFDPAEVLRSANFTFVLCWMSSSYVR